MFFGSSRSHSERPFCSERANCPCHRVAVRLLRHPVGQLKAPPARREHAALETRLHGRGQPLEQGRSVKRGVVGNGIVVRCVQPMRPVSHARSERLGNDARPEESPAAHRRKHAQDLLFVRRLRRDDEVGKMAAKRQLRFRAMLDIHRAPKQPRARRL